MRLDPPKVAVVMATYARDDAGCLRQAFDSIRLQDYDPSLVNLYIARDGPVPESIERILADQRARGARVLCSEQNRGLTHALNSCLQSLRDEEFVFRMDGDDVATPDRLRRQVEYMILHSEVDILGGAIEECDYEGKSLGVRRYPRSDQVRNYICLASPVAHPTVCFRRSALSTLGRYPDVALNEDLEMWFMALRAGLIIDNLPEVILRYRISRDFHGRRGSAKALREFRSYVRGIWALHGVTWRLVYPLVRLLLRLMPAPVIQAAYHGLPGRRRLLNR